jgi:hypothetical protein
MTAPFLDRENHIGGSNLARADALQSANNVDTQQQVHDRNNVILPHFLTRCRTRRREEMVEVVILAINKKIQQSLGARYAGGQGHHLLGCLS